MINSWFWINWLLWDDNVNESVIDIYLYYSLSSVGVFKCTDSEKNISMQMKFF